MSSQSLCSKEGPEDEVLKFSKALLKWGSVFCQHHQVGSISNGIIKSVVSPTTTRHGELKINLCLSYQRLLIINPCSLHLIDLESKKHEDLKMSFLFLLSLSESRDEIPVKWGNLSHPKIFDFGCA